MPFKPTAETAVHALDQVQQLAAQKQYSWIDGVDVSLSSATGSIETDITAGTVVYNGEQIDISSTSVTHSAGDADNPRWDAVCITDRDGTVEVFPGTPAKPITDSDGNVLRGEAAFKPSPPDSVTTEIICLAIVWIPSGATSNSDLTDTGSGGVATPVIDRRVYQTGFVEQATRRTTITSSGWFTIASQTPLGTGPESSLKLANGLFTVRDTQAGRNSSTTFWASYQDGSEPTITVLNSSAGSDTRAIQGTRIVAGASGEGAEVQINVQLNTNSQVSIVEYTLQNNNHYSGWWPEDWITGTQPQGYNSTDMYWRDSGYVFASATDGTNLAQFGVDRDGNASMNDLDRDTLGVRGYLSSSTTVPNSQYVHINYDSLRFSNLPGFDTATGEFTAPTDGYYLCHATVGFESITGGSRVVMFITDLGDETLARSHAHSGTQAPLSSHIDDVVKLSKGTTIDFALQQYSGGSRPLMTGPSNTFFSIVKMG